MARRSRMSMLKRQREVKKNEKAAHKRARRHGQQEEYFTEPQPTVLTSDPDGQPDPGEPGESDSDDPSSTPDKPAQQ